MDAQAYYPTEHAAKYIRQLASHFAHKIDVTETADGAAFALDTTRIRLVAEPQGLRAVIEGDSPAHLVEARHVIDKHLVNYAFREGFIGMNWV